MAKNIPEEMYTGIGSVGEGKYCEETERIKLKVGRRSNRGLISECVGHSLTMTSWNLGWIRNLVECECAVNRC